MGEGFKNRLILVLITLSVLFFLGTISSCGDARRLRSARDKEMATRLDLEEKMSKFSQDKQDTEGKLDELIRQLEEEKAAHLATKKLLIDEQLVNQDLKEELDKIIRLKETLEEDLKEALTKDKKKR
ncbi:MAG: hypothetical protein JW788_02720 [Candidatus Omnitrophica bacterium]|nr:hypothetical protein [Candidatus Omnitrophota bacterium]